MIREVSTLPGVHKEMIHSKLLTLQIIFGLLCIPLGIYTMSNSVYIGVFIATCGATLSIGTIVLILKVKQHD